MGDMEGVGVLPEGWGSAQEHISAAARDGTPSGTGDGDGAGDTGEVVAAGPAEPPDGVGAAGGILTSGEDRTREGGAGADSDARRRSADVEAALEEARRQGFSMGLQEARAAAEEELRKAKEEARRIVESARERASQEAQALIHSLSLRIVGLALEISKKIIQEEVATRPGLILKVAVSALSRAKGGDVAVIRANPADASVLEEGKDDLRGQAGWLREIRVEKDSSITRGGCIVETEGGVVDSTVETQLQEIGRTLQSSLESGTGGA